MTLFIQWLLFFGAFYVLLTLVNWSGAIPWLLAHWCQWAHATEHVRAWSDGRLRVRCAKCQRESAGVEVAR